VGGDVGHSRPRFPACFQAERRADCPFWRAHGCLAPSSGKFGALPLGRFRLGLQSPHDLKPLEMSVPIGDMTIYVQAKRVALCRATTSVDARRTAEGRLVDPRLPTAREIADKTFGVQ